MTRGHILRVTERRPFVQVKLALGADGSVPRGAGGEPAWVTGQPARAHGHLLRAHARRHPGRAAHGDRRRPAAHLPAARAGGTARRCVSCWRAIAGGSAEAAGSWRRRTRTRYGSSAVPSAHAQRIRVGGRAHPARAARRRRAVAARRDGSLGGERHHPAAGRGRPADVARLRRCGASSTRPCYSTPRRG